jgi:hypothetical protein
VIGVSLIFSLNKRYFIHVFNLSDKQRGKNGERCEPYGLRSDRKKLVSGTLFLRERKKESDLGVTIA